MTLHPKGAARQALDDSASTSLDRFFRQLEVSARAHDLGDESVYLAEELVELPWSLGDRERQALALLVLASFVSARQGSTRLPLGGGVGGTLGRLVASLIKAGGLDVAVGPTLREISDLARTVTFDQLIGRAGEYRPLIVADGYLYQHRLYRCEQRLVERLRARFDQSPQSTRTDVDAAIADVALHPAIKSGSEIELSDEQIEAVRGAVTSSFSVVSGGPGTGKTAIIVSILRVMHRLGIPTDRVVLAAPTGKAAQRMAGSIREGLTNLRAATEADQSLLSSLPEPSTLHRALGYQPTRDRFRHHENHPLAASLVIVDEGSMIDIVLMERLLRAVEPTTRLVLLGDADQLPSVDAGAVLRDLVLAGQESPGAAVPKFAYKLTRSYRMDPSDPSGRAILTTARAVDQGNVRELLKGKDTPIVTRKSASELTYRGVELIDTTKTGGALRTVLEDWFERRIACHPRFDELTTRTYHRRDGELSERDESALRELFAHYETSRLLTVTRKLEAGSEVVNQFMHEQLLARQSSLATRPDLFPGEPIMVRRNDYQRGLFNGDQGLVVRVSDDEAPHRFRAVFPRGDRLVVFNLDALRPSIELAFAITVHKSQGSELNHLGLILPTADLPLLTRELLYTGITRARRSVALIGDRALLRSGIVRTAERYSGVADQLCAKR
jgi:exodeoxyribonuclease V alpha subunit